MTLEYIIDALQKNKIPKFLLKNKTESEINNLYDFVKKSKFTLIHIAESTENKINHYQNSTAWIKIEPLDIFIGNDVKYKEGNTISCVNGFQFHEDFEGKEELLKDLNIYLNNNFKKRLYTVG